MSGFYLYGIVAAPGPHHLTVNGLDRQPVQLYPRDPFILVYSEAQQERYLASRANLLAHEVVLEKIMSDGHRAVLPLQFGLVVSSWDQVERDLFATRGEQLLKLLHDLDGKREVGVKVFWDGEKELQLGLEANPTLKQQRDDMAGAPLGLDAVVRIGRELEQLLEDRRTEITETFTNTLAPLSSDRVDGDLLTENMAYNASFLISWDTEPLFAQKVEELDHLYQGRLRIRYNNFTAPYNFTKL